MDCPIVCFWHSERVYISSKGFYVFSFYHVVYVVTSCFLSSFYSPYVILFRIVQLIPKVSHGKPELPTTTILILYRDIGPAVRVFANGPGDLGSIPGRVIPKTLKMVLDTTLLNTQHYKVRFKGKVEQSWEWSSALPYTLV